MGLAGAGRAALANPRFRSNETLRRPISLRALSDCFAQIVLDVSDMLSALRYHYGEPEEAAEEAVSIA